MNSGLNIHCFAFHDLTFFVFMSFYFSLLRSVNLKKLHSFNTLLPNFNLFLIVVFLTAKSSLLLTPYLIPILVLLFILYTAISRTSVYSSLNVIRRMEPSWQSSVTPHPVCAGVWMQMEKRNLIRVRLCSK